MGKTFLLGLLLISVTSCKSQSCSVDTVEYRRNVKSILDYHKQDTIVSSKNFLDAIVYLNNTTGIKAQYARKYFPEYEEDTLLKQDVEKWRQWFESCTGKKWQ